MSRAFFALFLRDLWLAMRIGGGASTASLFFLGVVVMAPFAIGPDLVLLARIGPAILWLGALLSSLLSLDRLFQADYEDGSLDVLRLSPMPLEMVVLAKVAAQWVTTGLPLAILAPVLGALLNVAPAAGMKIALTLLVGTPALAFIGAVGAGLTVALRRGGLLIPVLILPFAVPVLIFGVLAATSGAALLILIALSLGLGVIGTAAAAAALRGAE